MTNFSEVPQVQSTLRIFLFQNHQIVIGLKSVKIILTRKPESRLPFFQESLTPPAMVTPSQPSESPAAADCRGLGGSRVSACAQGSSHPDSETPPKTGAMKPNHLGQEYIISPGCLTHVTNTASSCEGVMGQPHLSLSKKGCILRYVFTQSVWELNAV